MKKIIFTLFVSFIVFTAQSQDYIETAMKSGYWVSSPQITDTTLFGMDELFLYKASRNLDSIAQKVTVWEFSDSLKLYSYNPDTDSLLFVNQFYYEYFQHQFYLKDEQKLTFGYRIGITSSGKFLMFVREEE